MIFPHYSYQGEIWGLYHCFPPTRRYCSPPEVLALAFEIMMPPCVQQLYLHFRADVHLVEEEGL